MYIYTFMNLYIDIHIFAYICLIEKEWVAFDHKFALRLGHTPVLPAVVINIISQDVFDN